ncbi:MAG: replication-relaxation family protein [Solirubrobacterales bacterium]
MTRRRVTAAHVARLAETLSARELAVVATLDRVRVATAGQLRRLHFTAGTERANARQAQRRLRVLVERRVLAELDRQIGGTGGGSAQAIYALDVAGQRLGEMLGPAGGRRLRRPWTPGLPFLAHTLDVTELYVRLREWEHGGGELLAFDAEPACWRRFSGLGGARTWLKPDAFVRTAAGDFEHVSFVEVDRDTASLPGIARRLGVYARYLQTDASRETRRYGVFPRLVLLAPDAPRRDALADVVAAGPSELRTVAVAHRFADALSVLAGDAPDTPLTGA